MECKQIMKKASKAFSNITEEEYLAQYSLQDYPTYAITADTVLFSLVSKEDDNYRKDPELNLSVLLVHRKAHPQRGLLAVPGGFLRPDETIAQCAMREIKEETGAVPELVVPAGVFSGVKRDPRGRIISNVFMSVYPAGEKLISGGDAEDAGWYTVKLENMGEGFLLELCSPDRVASANLIYAKESPDRHLKTEKSSGLAFDHAEIIATAVLELRRHVLDFDWLFRFLPEKFTLNSLQQVYEAVIGEKVLTANFRRKISEYVQETEEFVTGLGHRPARLFIKRSQ